MNKIGIIGFGKTGKALLDYIIKNEKFERLIIYNDEDINNGEIIKVYKKSGVEFYFGSDHFKQLNQLKLIIISPGVDGQTERFRLLKQKGIRVISEIEYAFERTDAQVVAITGTNGKSTTTVLIDHFLKAQGIKSILCGNIGDPMISKVTESGPESVAVVEVSSFQLEEISSFRPKIALILNITPDHLDRYGNLDNYFKAKLNIVNNQDSEDFLILNGKDKILLNNEAKLGKAQKVYFNFENGTKENYISINSHQMVLKMGNTLHTISLKNNRLMGIHNLENIAAAIAAVHLLGVKKSVIEKSLNDFTGLKHRMQMIGRVNGVGYINDSKATNIDSALKSIQSISGNKVVILGGKDKDGDFSLLEGELKKEVVKKIILIGSASAKIAEQLKSLKDKFKYVESLDQAVETGFMALNGTEGMVILAPGCASFDMFNNFEHRGLEFERAVMNYKESVNGEKS